MVYLLLTLAAFALYAVYVHDNRFEIYDRADPSQRYLVRWHLFRCRWFRVFLHRIYRPDDDRHLHNHPWPNALAIVLRGGYGEFSRSAPGVARYSQYTPGQVACDHRQGVRDRAHVDRKRRHRLNRAR